MTFPGELWELVELLAMYEERDQEHRESRMAWFSAWREMGERYAIEYWKGYRLARDLDEALAERLPPGSGIESFAR